MRGYRLLFRGAHTGAVATVEPREGASVPVLVWEITPADEAALDRYEGWPHLYRKEDITITFGGGDITVMAYIMNAGPLGLPGAGYLGTILEGYEALGFDPLALDAAVKASQPPKGATWRPRQRGGARQMKWW
jgi:hypothetical protein